MEHTYPYANFLVGKDFWGFCTFGFLRSNFIVHPYMKDNCICQVFTKLLLKDTYTNQNLLRIINE